ncbi:MAG TPA: ferredoxin [Dehalococcoidia bacterium]|jgi:ferredoxin|nr:ferredoxin [Dehalococcoidia bacterium]
MKVKKVKVDSEKCQGHNRCYALAPGMFKVDDYGYAQPQGDGVLADEDDIELAQRAVDNCPERAIYIVEEEE